jgi:O-antigen ligase
MSTKEYLKKICNHTGIYFTVATLLLILFYMIVNNDLTRGIHPGSQALLLPFSFLLAAANMIFSMTSASIITLVIFALGFLFAYVFKLKKILCLSPYAYVVIYLALNVIMMYYMRWFIDGDINATTDAATLNGRIFIWDEAMKLIEKKPITGYGAYGVLIEMFWHAKDEGMNYAHNELLQRLMDGGVVLMIAFLFWLLSYVKPIQKIKHDKGAMGMANLCLIAMLFVMVFESLTEYYYIFLFLSLLTFAPEFVKDFPQKSENDTERDQKENNKKENYLLKGKRSNV